MPQSRFPRFGDGCGPNERDDVPEISASPFLIAGEHLIEFTDKVLEAFHTGTGLINNSPVPMTLDIARSIIWNEVRRTMQNLQEDAGSPNAPNADSCLWLRVEGTSAQEILAACGELGNRSWILRGYGPRVPDHPTVIYAIVRPVENPMEVRAILAQLASHNLHVRDFTLGPFPY